MASNEALRILTLSNLYPPYYVGGYELGCKDVMDGLVSRGHDITVLTSTFGLGREVVEGRVHRQLKHRATAAKQEGRFSLLRSEIHNRRVVQKALHTTMPHVVMIWNMANVSHFPIFEVARSGSPVVFAISDYWMIEDHDKLLTLWKHIRSGLSTRRVGRLAQSILRTVWLRDDAPRWQEVDLRTSFFTSEALRQHYASVGFNTLQSAVIHWGVRIPSSAGPSFGNRDRLEAKDGQFRILYVGQIVPHKGVDTLVKAVSLLQKQNRIQVNLTIVGGGLDQAYQDRIKQSIEHMELQNVTRFVGKLAREDMERYYRTHDVLVFPSRWDEPFSITLLEAMAHKIPIVSTLTGGSAEVLRDGENCLAFPAGDAKALASQILRVAANEDLRQSLRERAYKQVCEDFSLDSMVSRVETFLVQASTGTRGSNVWS